MEGQNAVANFFGGHSRSTLDVHTVSVTVRSAQQLFFTIFFAEKNLGADEL